MDEKTTETSIEPQKQTFKELLEKIVKQNEEIIEKKEAKPFKLPWGAKPSKKQVAKGFAIIEVIRNNGGVDFFKAPIVDGIVNLDGFPRITTIDYKLHHKFTPLYIIPEWSMKPFSPVENYSEVDKEKMNMAGRKLILARLVSEKINPAKKGLGGGWIWFAVAGIAAIYFISQGGKLW